MTERFDLYSKIDEVIADLNSYYLETLREGTSLKDKIDTIEKNLAEGKSDGAMERDMTLASERLDLLVDYLVSASGKLDDLKESCKKVEDLMTSFLCFSLSRFREKKARTKR